MNRGNPLFQFRVKRDLAEAIRKRADQLYMEPGQYLIHLARREMSEAGTGKQFHIVDNVEIYGDKIVLSNDPPPQTKQAKKSK